jgi:hypothetical protein
VYYNSNVTKKLLVGKGGPSYDGHNLHFSQKEDRFQLNSDAFLDASISVPG